MELSTASPLVPSSCPGQLSHQAGVSPEVSAGRAASSQDAGAHQQEQGWVGRILGGFTGAGRGGCMDMNYWFVPGQGWSVLAGRGGRHKSLMNIPGEGGR